MPYIKPDARKPLDKPIKKLIDRQANEGELNYIFTRLLKNFIRRLGGSYAAINAAIGVLECCKMELYRRDAAPYEDEKMRENGDV